LLLARPATIPRARVAKTEQKAIHFNLQKVVTRATHELLAPPTHRALPLLVHRWNAHRAERFFVSTLKTIQTLAQRCGIADGRDHNPNAMSLWLAGGGCNAGHTIGATDELGMTAVEGKAHIRDFHVTVLRLLGLDDNKLTYYHAGRFKQLSQFGGQLIKNLIA
jgi:hypothetical protein